MMPLDVFFQLLTEHTKDRLDGYYEDGVRWRWQQEELRRRQLRSEQALRDAEVNEWLN